MAAYLNIHKPSIKSINLEITRHKSAIPEPLHSRPKQACLLQILGLPVRSHLWCSVRIAIIAKTCHSCRSIVLFWSRKKSNRLHVLKLHTSINLQHQWHFPVPSPQLCLLMHELNLHAAQLSWTGQNLQLQYDTCASGHNNVTTSPSLCFLYSPSRFSNFKDHLLCLLTICGFSPPCLFVATLLCDEC